MAILSDGKILERISEGSIKIEPFRTYQLGTNSYDVRLSKVLMLYKNTTLDPKKDLPTFEIEIPENGFTLEPGRLYLGVTEEYTETHKDVMIFEGKSSLARLGLSVHITAGFCENKFSGNITLELFCIQPITIYPSMRIGQIYYTTTVGKIINPYDKKEDAKYNNHSNKPIKSMMWKTFQQDAIRTGQAKRDWAEDAGIPNLPEQE